MDTSSSVDVDAASGSASAEADNHAVYKELSRINGRINGMKRNAVISKLRQFNLNTEGSCVVLRKRLKNHYARLKLAGITARKFLPFYVIVDFEATCEQVNAPGYMHEIIEFPAILVSSEKLQIVDHFQAYCKPELNPKLSDFCVELTGITQEQVDSAQPFAQVLESFKEWLKKHQLGNKYKYAVVTDGPWDMGRFLYKQCKISKIPFPHFGKKWINVRKTFSSFYRCKRFCLKMMLEHLGIDFEGRPHCGLDDARNIARILLHLMTDGADIHVNERIHSQTGGNRNHSGGSGQAAKSNNQYEHTGVTDMESDGSSEEEPGKENRCHEV